MSLVYNNRGTAYAGRGDHDRAIQDLNEAIRLSPTHAYMYRNRGIDFYEKRDYGRAIQDFDEAIHLKPNDPDIYDMRGKAYVGGGDYDRGIQDFNQSIQISPIFALAYRDRGSAYMRKDDFDRAIQDYDQAMRLNPNDSLAYCSRGVAYYHKGDYDTAIKNYNEALLLNANLALAYERRADAYLAQSKITAAIADFEHTISIAPSSNTAVFAAVMLHVVMKRQGNNDSEQLAKVASAADLSKWPGLLLNLYLGQMTADEVMNAAVNEGPGLKKSAVCEANYFTGEDALFHHQQKTALARFKAARESCSKSDTSYTLASAELKRLGATAATSK